MSWKAVAPCLPAPDEPVPLPGSFFPLPRSVRTAGALFLRAPGSSAAIPPAGFAIHRRVTAIVSTDFPSGCWPQSC